MDAKDLRIGNKVECFGIREVIAIKKDKIKVQHESKHGNFIIEWVPITSLSLEPIPLTKEILLKCGFVKYDGWDDQKYWCLPDEHGKPNRFELFETDNGFLLPSDENVEFLHQLQNCYYFHSLKEELIINL